jgi:phenylacetate-coenzyme A ligase PaaK-like adenylate-forming protein
MPFIRYRIGDLATRAPSCACGTPFTALGAVQGRMIDYFPLPDGRLLHPYEIVTRLVWGTQGWIRQYQLVQERRDSVVLYVVAETPPSDDQVAEVSRAVRPVLGDRVRFEVRSVPRIPFESTGKLRPSRSLVWSEYDQSGSRPLSA